MAVKLARYLFRKIGGRIVPIRIGSKSDIGKVVYHQTTRKAAISIKSKGFRLRKRGAGAGDDLPFGIFTKSTPKKIGLPGKNQTQIMAIDKTKKTKTFFDRNEFEKYMKVKSKTFAALSRKHQLIDKGSNAKVDKLMKIGMNRKKTVSGKLNRALHRWEQLTRHLSKEMSRLATVHFKKKGYESVKITKDVGGFGKVTDTKIILNPKKVIPVGAQADAASISNKALRKVNQLLKKGYKFKKTGSNDYKLIKK